MGKIYWLDDYRELPLTLQQRIDRIKQKRERVLELQEQMIEDIKNDKDVRR